MSRLLENKLKELGIILPKPPKPLGAYRPCVRTLNLLYVSGQLPVEEGELKYKGKLGDELTVEQGKDAARIAAINCISVLKHELGQLEKVGRIVKVTGYVSSAPGFQDQAAIVNGASDLFFEVFGEKGIHARVAVGVYELPKGSPVEIELIAETDPGYNY